MVIDTHNHELAGCGREAQQLSAGIPDDSPKRFSVPQDGRKRTPTLQAPHAKPSGRVSNRNSAAIGADHQMIDWASSVPAWRYRHTAIGDLPGKQTPPVVPGYQ